MTRMSPGTHAPVGFKNTVVDDCEPTGELQAAWVENTTSEGYVVEIWKLTWRERLDVLLTGALWSTAKTYRRVYVPIGLSTRPPAKVFEAVASVVRWRERVRK